MFSNTLFIVIAIVSDLPAAIETHCDSDFQRCITLDSIVLSYFCSV